MYECLPSPNFLPNYSFNFHKFRFTSFFKLPRYSNGRIPSSKATFITLSSNWNWDPIPFASDEHDYDEDLIFGLLEKEHESKMESPAAKIGIDEEGERLGLGENFKFKGQKEDDKRVKEDGRVKSQGLDSKLEGKGRCQGSVEAANNMRQMARRSSVMAKQVISIRSALSLGFISQLWVDTSSATLKDFVSRRSHGSVLNMQVGLLSYILVIQFLVKPKLPDEKIFFNHGPWYLCAPSMVSISLIYTYILDWPLNNKRKLLPHVAAESHGRLNEFYNHIQQLESSIATIGDVVLVEDENVIEDIVKMVGLETLVGYTVVTPSGQHIGKVRGYTFNINCGAVKLLELDSYGITIIPSSLVTTYALYIEDVVEVLSDTVVVRADAVSRMQRLTKGFWNGQNTSNVKDEFEELDDDGTKRHKKSSRRKFSRKMRKNGVEWEVPMDYL